MKILISRILIVLSTLSAATLLFADAPGSSPGNPGSSSINWISRSNEDVITIQNGTSLSLIVTINVANDSEAGVNVTNCGTTTHINPGSSAICSTSDAASPVNFVTDGYNKAAQGTYQIRQQTQSPFYPYLSY